MMNQKKRKIFRQSAIDRLSSPEQLDQLMRITSPLTWVALGGIALLLATAIVWGSFGRIPIETTAPVIFVKTDGLYHITAPQNGQIADLNIAPNSVIRSGEAIGSIQFANDSTTLYAALDGHILSVDARTGDDVSDGETIARFERVGDDVKQEAVLFLPVGAAVALRPDMSVVLHSESESRRLHGIIAKIGKTPLTEQQAERIAGSDMALDRLNFAPGYVAVHIEILNPLGTEINLVGGTFGNARIQRGEQRPVRLILPARTAETP